MLKKIASLVLLASASSAHAAFPEKPITLIVPYAAGGLTDVVSRAVANEARKGFGQQIIIENRVGAGGKIGLELLRRAPKDGYTLATVVPALMVTLPLTQRDFGMTPKDFEPITVAVETFTVLVLSQRALPGLTTLQGFIDHAKRNPAKINYATPGIGTSRHFDNVLFAQKFGIVDPRHVVYKGEAPALTDLAGGVFHYMLASEAAKPLIDSGRLVPIAVASKQRVPPFPSIPTFRELGQDFVTNGWVGFVASAGVPADVLERLNNVFAGAIKAPTTRQALLGMGYQPVGNSRGEFRELIDTDTTRYTGLLRSGAVKIEP